MPSASIELPAVLRDRERTEGPRAVAGADIASALRQLSEEDPRLRPMLFTPQGLLRRSFAVLVNGVDVRNLDGPSTPLHDGDRIVIVASSPGG